ncbi:acetoacetate decarboxylase [Halorubrum sp. C3]|nr:acetoacetate decarboxylase [Halorubrum sp. C3]
MSYDQSAAEGSLRQNEYRGMPTGEQVPSPQLLENVRMFFVAYEADPDVLRQELPPGLEPHPSNTIRMDMYRVPDGRMTSHLDEFTLTYLSIEIDEHDSTAITASTGEEKSLPGRYWVGYWTDSSQMQKYVREFGGIPAEEGTTSWDWDGNSLSSTLSVDGRDVIDLQATAAPPESAEYEPKERVTGHFNYYARRQIPTLSGHRTAIDELVEFPIPSIFDVYEAEVESLEFDFPEPHYGSQFAPTEPLNVTDIVYGENSFAYPIGRQIKNYQTE